MNIQPEKLKFDQRLQKFAFFNHHRHRPQQNTLVSRFMSLSIYRSPALFFNPDEGIFEYHVLSLGPGKGLKRRCGFSHISRRLCYNGWDAFRGKTFPYHSFSHAEGGKWTKNGNWGKGAFFSRRWARPQPPRDDRELTIIEKTGDRIMHDIKKESQAPHHPEEQLILVDGDDNVLGYSDKGSCHARDGLLHRAFSVFLFNDENTMLLQRRSKEKLLWPLYWSNSVCSHPRKGETYETAAVRRVKEELGIECKLRFLFKFQYQVNFEDIGAEHELCAVFIGKTDSPLIVNKEEIAEVKYLSMDMLEAELKVKSELYSPWFKVEWGRIRNDHLLKINSLFASRFA